MIETYNNASCGGYECSDNLSKSDKSNFERQR
jgi:hypothetical protein